MNRRNSSLRNFAVAAGAALLFAVPATAQAYATYTDNFDSDGLYSLIRGVAGANYNYTQQTALAFNLANGSAVSANTLSTGFNSRAEGGSGKAVNVAWQADTVAGNPTAQGSTSDTGFEGWTSSSASITSNRNPTIDMTGQVSFDVYIDSTTASTVLCQLMVDGDPSTGTALGQYAGGGFADLWTVGATPSNGADNGTIPYQTTPVATATYGAGGFPTGGKPIATGSWQTVTFNLGSDPRTLISPSGTYPTSGLGELYGIYFTPVTPANNQIYSLNIDNLTISSAPEPSAWLGLAAGGAMLLGLGLVSARRRRGAAAA